MSLPRIALVLFCATITVTLAPLSLPTPVQAQSMTQVSSYTNPLGREKRRSNVQTMIRQLGQYRVQKLNPQVPAYYYSFVNRGVELHFNAAHRIDLVVLLNARAFGAYQKYTGQLPKNLSFSDSSAAAQKKLGKPQFIERDAASGEYALVYESAGYSAVFQSEGGPLKYVELYRPVRTPTKATAHLSKETLRLHSMQIGARDP